MTKEEIDELMKIEGAVRGQGILENIDFIREEKGEEGVKKLEDTMVQLGYPEYREIKPMSFYPIGLNAATLVAIKRLFGFDEKKFQEMGRAESKVSLFIRLFLKYFVSFERIAREAPKVWRKYSTVGNLKVVEYDKEKRYGILRVENYRLIPIQCHLFIGYFSNVIQMIIGKEATCEETKCVHRGDEYHEFLLKW